MRLLEIVDSELASVQRNQFKWSPHIERVTNNGYLITMTCGDISVSFAASLQSNRNFLWGVNDAHSTTQLNKVKKEFGKTGIMPALSTALVEVVKMMLHDNKPPSLTIFGSDPKRQALYKSWATVPVAGYKGFAYQYPPDSYKKEGGVIFVRDGVDVSTEIDPTLIEK